MGNNTEELVEQAYLRLSTEILRLKHVGMIPKATRRIRRSEVRTYATLAGDNRQMKTISEIPALEFLEWRKKQKGY